MKRNPVSTMKRNPAALKKSEKPTLNLPLDTVAERFRNNPTDWNAKTYRDVALEYWADEMIGDESLLEVLKEIVWS